MMPKTWTISILLWLATDFHQLFLHEISISVASMYFRLIFFFVIQCHTYTKYITFQRWVQVWRSWEALHCHQKNSMNFSQSFFISNNNLCIILFFRFSRKSEKNIKNYQICPIYYFSVWYFSLCFSHAFQDKNIDIFQIHFLNKWLHIL